MHYYIHLELGKEYILIYTKEALTSRGCYYGSAKPSVISNEASSIKLNGVKSITIGAKQTLMRDNEISLEIVEEPSGSMIDNITGLSVEELTKQIILFF